MRRTHVLKAAVVMAAAVLSMAAQASPAAAAPHTVVCVGTTTLDPPTNYTSNGAAGLIVVRFDFTGVHDFCLGDGSVVVATMAGNLTQFSHDDGTGSIVVRYTVSVPGGTLDGIVQARFSPTSFKADIVAFRGTGTLSRVTGRGATTPTGPNTFSDRIVYRYP